MQCLENYKNTTLSYFWKYSLKLLQDPFGNYYSATLRKISFGFEKSHQLSWKKEITNLLSWKLIQKYIRDHSLSMCIQFTENKHFIPSDAHTFVSVSGLRIISFPENFRTYQMNDPLSWDYITN